MSKEPFPCSIISTLKSNLEVKLEEYKVALEEVRVEGTTRSVERLRAIEVELETLNIAIEKELNKAGYSLEEVSTLSTRYEHPDGRVEDVTLDIESTLEDFEDFYNTHGIPVPSDFAPKIREIFNNNQIKIREQIKTKGFNKMLVVPGNLSLPDIVDKLQMENGYFLGDNFKNAGGFAIAIEPTYTKNHRLILIHDAKELTDRPELASTLKITGTDAQNQNPLSLTDYLVLAKHHYTQTSEHLGGTKAIWMSTKSGINLVCVVWFPDRAGFIVDSRDSLFLNDDLGVRPSAVFT